MIEQEAEDTGVKAESTTSAGALRLFGGNGCVGLAHIAAGGRADLARTDEEKEEAVDPAMVEEVLVMAGRGATGATSPRLFASHPIPALLPWSRGPSVPFLGTSCRCRVDTSWGRKTRRDWQPLHYPSRPTHYHDSPANLRSHMPAFPRRFGRLPLCPRGADRSNGPGKRRDSFHMHC